MNSALNNIISDPGFFGLSIIALFGALGVILEKNIIRAGFSLVICFSAIAGIYFAMHAPFVGASQILIYSVGITLVIIFGLMLTNQKQDLPEIKGEFVKKILSAVIALGIFSAFSYVLVGNKWIIDAKIGCPKNTEVLGLKLLGSYALPFELISVLLLVAMIGAIVIAKKDKKNA